MSGYRGDPELGEVKLASRLAKLETFVEQWWARWQQDAFSMFTPRKKWQVEHRNMQQGDVVLLLSNKKLGPASYQLAVVREVIPDHLGVIRTVIIGLPSRKRRGGVVRCDEMRMAVQRLAVILPVEEQWEGELAQEAN